jgi:hypothetical protein
MPLFRRYIGLQIWPRTAVVAADYRRHEAGSGRCRIETLIDPNRLNPQGTISESAVRFQFHSNQRWILETGRFPEFCFCRRISERPVTCEERSLITAATTSFAFQKSVIDYAHRIWRQWVGSTRRRPAAFGSRNFTGRFPATNSKRQRSRCDPNPTFRGVCSQWPVTDAQLSLTMPDRRPSVGHFGRPRPGSDCLPITGCGGVTPIGADGQVGYRESRATFLVSGRLAAAQPETRYLRSRVQKVRIRQAQKGACKRQPPRGRTKHGFDSEPAEAALGTPAGLSSSRPRNAVEIRE